MFKMLTEVKMFLQTKNCFVHRKIHKTAWKCACFELVYKLRVPNLPIWIDYCILHSRNQIKIAIHVGSIDMLLPAYLNTCNRQGESVSNTLDDACNLASAAYLVRFNPNVNNLTKLSWLQSGMSFWFMWSACRSNWLRVNIINHLPDECRFGLA